MGPRGMGWRAPKTPPPAARMARAHALVSGREPHSGGQILLDVRQPEIVSARAQL